MKLVVRMENRELVNSATGFTSKDDCEQFMKRIFAFLGLPYKKPFACSSIVADSATKKIGPLGNRPGVKPAWKPADNFGPNAFILNDSVIGKVRVVCAGDFQNVTLDLLERILSGTPLADVKALAHLEMFRELPEAVVFCIGLLNTAS